MRRQFCLVAVAAALSFAGSAQAGTLLLPDLTNGAATITASPADFPVAESPDKAFDNDRLTKGLIFNDGANDNAAPFEDVSANNPVSWAFAFAGGQQQQVLSYSLTSANDAPERDPRDFFLEGSNDGLGWTLVDTVTNHQFVDQPLVGDQSIGGASGPDRYETYFFNVDAPASFSQYRLRLIETFGTTNDRPQIAEIQLFGTQVPEPAAASLLAVAAGAILGRRRRRGL
jgi:hypothetical protein